MTYEYKCKDCGEVFDVNATLAEKTAGLYPVCTRCGSKETTQVFSGFGILSGSGTSGGLSGMPPGCGPGMGAGCC